MNLISVNNIIKKYEDLIGLYYQRKYENYYKKLYKLSKISYRLEIRQRNKLNKCKITKNEKKDIKKYWKNYTKDFKLYAHKYYVDKNGNKDKRFIPDDIYAEYIEQYYNNAKLAPAFSDKNYFDLYLNGYSMPKTYIHYINNCFLNDSYKAISKNQAIKILSNKHSFVVKQTIGSSGGAGVRVCENYNTNQIKELLNNPFSSNLIFQEKIKQCALFNRFSSSSINTIRIYTYWYNDEIYVSNSVLRIGVNGAKTDNSSGGGLSFHIDDKDKLILIPRDILGRVDTEFIKNNNINYSNEKLCFMKNVKSLVKSAAMRLPHFKIISWDIAISEEYKPIIIEYNVANTIPDINQIGAYPFFGELTDKILEEVFKGKKQKEEGLNTSQYI